MRTITIRLHWGATGERLFVTKVEGNGIEERLAIVPLGKDVDVLLDCCGEPKAFDALTAGNARGVSA